MSKEEKDLNHDVIDDDLYEEIDEEQMAELIEEARQQSILKQQDQENRKRKLPKWPIWIISIALIINLIAVLPQTFSIPAIDFLMTSTRLSTDPIIKQYKKAVTVIETDDSRGTGFSISGDGIILTNDHVIEGEETVTVAFPDEGLFNGHVIETYPDIDLAVIKVDTEKQLPFLTLAESTTFSDNELIYFIGNPLGFHGIANEGTIIDYIQLKNWDVPVLMLDAPVYRGNSGSPVINQHGDVIGVVFATLHHETEGRVGLFVPIDNYYTQQE